MKCPCCPMDVRSDNLIRHLFTHKAEWFAKAPKKRLLYLYKNRTPLLVEKPLGVNKTDVDWAVCLACGEGKCKGIKGHFPAEWVNNHKEQCTKKSLFDKFKDLYISEEDDEEEQTNTIVIEHKCPVDKQIVYVNVENCKHCNTLEENMTDLSTDLENEKVMVNQYNDWKFKIENLFHTYRNELELMNDSFDMSSKDVKICLKKFDNVITDLGHMLDIAPYNELENVQA